jgi:hypothetical protein
LQKKKKKKKKKIKSNPNNLASNKVPTSRFNPYHHKADSTPSFVVDEDAQQPIAHGHRNPWPPNPETHGHRTKKPKATEQPPTHKRKHKPHNHQPKTQTHTTTIANCKPTTTNPPK